ncbi:MAG: undecaprenyldiphospho-muramoylpentapeptide beta-N-acetylglucosaminyltransferase [Deltaproteobacteria bacterium]|nr:undecaprenyldiphospho-muramoylpentapeptide beta-N-acetylglucosaminyltransferase [Deltaproteobacteria bacterium]
MAGLVFAGGGTGGHLFPGLAMAEDFRMRTAEIPITFIGTGRQLEQRVLKETGYPLETISTTGLTNKRGFRKAGAFFKVVQGIFESVFLLRRLRPSLVIGLGGYSSGPVGLAAYLMGIPLILQEQNARPGLTNRWLARFARAVLVSYDESLDYFPEGLAKVTGNPVRKPFLHCPDRRDPSMTHVLITGGSQGAHAINTVAPEAIRMMIMDHRAVRVTHQAGQEDLDLVRGAYENIGCEARVEAFIRDMAEAVSSADLVLGRAGATSLAEIAQVGRGAILIPYPFASHNHQEENARVWEKRGAARVLLESELSAESLAKVLDELIGDRSRLLEMAVNARGLSRPNAVEDAVAACLEYLPDDETH